MIFYKLLKLQNALLETIDADTDMEFYCTLAAENNWISKQVLTYTLCPQKVVHHTHGDNFVNS